MTQTWGSRETGLKSAWFCGGGRAGTLHGRALLGTSPGQGLWCPPPSLKCLMDGGWVGGQVGQLVEDSTLTDDGIDQVGITIKLVLDNVVEDLQKEEDQVVVLGR